MPASPGAEGPGDGSAGLVEDSTSEAVGGLQPDQAEVEVLARLRVELEEPACILPAADQEALRSGQPPGEDELSWARTLATGSFSMGLETSDAVTDALVDLDVYGLPEDSLDTYRTRVRAITPEQIAAVAREHLHPDRLAIVLVGPAQAIAPQLEGLGPYQVVRP